jgi:hypothetical protein
MDRYTVSCTCNSGSSVISCPELAPSAVPDEMLQLLCTFFSALSGTQIAPPLPGEGLEISFRISPKERGA